MYSVVASDGEDKRQNIRTGESPSNTSPVQHDFHRADIRQGRAQLFYPKTPLCTGSASPPSISTPVSLVSSRVTPSGVPVCFSGQVSSVNSFSRGPRSPRAATLSSCTPLQTILTMLFGKQKGDTVASRNLTAEFSRPRSLLCDTVASRNLSAEFSRPRSLLCDTVASRNPSAEFSRPRPLLCDTVASRNLSAEFSRPRSLLCDPIVQRFGQDFQSKDDVDDEKPCEPNEAYDPGVGYCSEKTTSNVSVLEDSRASSAVVYDIEDKSKFREVKAIDSGDSARAKPAANRTASGSDCSKLMKQQRILDKLNKEIEHEKQQLEEQEEALCRQRAAIGMSMAHFSVSDALMSPPSKSSQLNDELTHLDQKVEDLISKHRMSAVITHSPEENANVWPASGHQRLMYQSLEKEKDPAEERPSAQLEFSCMQTTHRNREKYPPVGTKKPYAQLLREKVHSDMDSDYLPNAATDTLTDDKNCMVMLKGNELSKHKSGLTEGFFEPPESNPNRTTSYYISDNNTSSSVVSGITKNHMADGESALSLPMETQSPVCETPHEMFPSTPIQTQVSSHSAYIYRHHLEVSQHQADGSQSIPSTSVIKHESHNLSPPMSQKASPQNMKQGRFSKHQYNVPDCRPRLVSVRSQQTSFVEKVPPDSHVLDPRPSYSSFVTHRPRKPLLETPKGFGDLRYHDSNNFHQGTQQHEVQSSSALYRAGKNSSIRRDFTRGSQHECGRPRGPLEHHFTPLSQFKSQQASATSLRREEVPTLLHRRPFEDYRRWQSSEFQVQRGPPPSKCGGPEGQPDNRFLDARRQLQFNFQGPNSSEERPLKRSGPLLPTPPEYLILFDNSRRQNSDNYYQDHWHCSSDIGRRSSAYNSRGPWNEGNRSRGFHSGHKDKESVQWTEDLRRRGDADYIKSQRTGEEWVNLAQRERHLDRDNRGTEEGYGKESASEKGDKDLTRQRKRARDQHGKDSDDDKAKNCNGDHGRKRNRHDERDRDQERRSSPSRRRDRGHRKDPRKLQYGDEDRKVVQGSLERE